MEPWVLFRWSEDERQCYYSTKGLFASAIVQEMKPHCTMQELYNRLPWLTSPSDTFYLPEGATSSVVDGGVNSAQEIVIDGFGEMSLDFALQLGLVKQERVEEGPTTPCNFVVYLQMLTAT